MIVQEDIRLQTHGHGDMHNLTDSVARLVEAAGVSAGLVNVFNVGSTGVIGAIAFEPGLQEDLPAMLDRLIPPSREYGHERAWRDDARPLAHRPDSPGPPACDLHPIFHYRLTSGLPAGISLGYTA